MRHHFRHPQAIPNKGSLFYSHCVRIMADHHRMHLMMTKTPLKLELQSFQTLLVHKHT
jgi:hypothetical protein